MNLQMPIKIASNPIAISTPNYFTTLTQVQGWRHRISARGGFDTASFTLSGVSPSFLENWITDGLGYHVVRYDHIGQIMWEGYIHSVTITMLGRTVTRSLENLANVVRVSYALTDYDDCEQVSGETIITADASYVQSQDKYGIAVGFFGIGQASTAEAEAERDLYLTTYRWPTREIREAGDSRTEVSIECRGYSHWFKKRYYTRTTTSPATINASTIIASIVISSNFQYAASSEVQTNTFQVQNFYDAIDQWLSWDLLNKISDKGDGTNIWNWMMLEKRKFVYRQAPTAIAYFHYLYDHWRQVYTSTGTVVYPWQIRPDNYIRMPDMAIGYIQRTSNYALDLTTQYIYAMEWTEDDPFNYQLEYQNTDSLKAKLKGISLGVSF